MYFKEPGKLNTQKTCELALKKAQETGIKHIVVSSNTGYTLKYLIDSKLNLVCVTHQVGFREPGCDEMGEQKRIELKKAGVKLLTTTHLMGGIERAALRKFGGNGIQSITAYTLRMFGQGTKVCAEIATMALDAGLIPFGEDIIVIGGSGRGADTAWIIRPAHSQQYYDTEMKELICKPTKIKK
ncbi:hypothetical protein IMX26_09320 [Clostridium sp. 'deep sea']|uniref:pyruvate kinase alpha/beta domain-containing protein n=1 Tax=Clostridium sp. 'deep sea' TaxID=2779445 RepID=UPI00189667CE|nr:pyruvate kinase alpha/beta domain-containing protein [Clostridium sp. 'deep sea']QOR33701.1 hypothetical protein IMX26_09320 [Clostridium sp. 'deep sea']